MQPGRLPVQPGSPHRPARHSLGAHENADIFYFRSQSGGERECSRGACLCSLGRRADRRGTVWELMKMPIYSISGLSLVGSGSAAGAPACAAGAAAQTDAAQSGSSSLVTCAARQLYTFSAVGSTRSSRYLLIDYWVLSALRATVVLGLLTRNWGAACHPAHRRFAASLSSPQKILNFVRYSNSGRPREKV